MSGSSVVTVKVGSSQVPVARTFYTNPQIFRILGAADMSVVIPQDGQVLTWNAATQLFTLQTPSASQSLVLAQGAFDKANSANILAQAAFQEANSFQSVINTAFTTANSALAEAGSFQSVINTAYATANVSFSAFSEANSFQSIINSAFSRANTLDGIASLTVIANPGLTVNTAQSITITGNNTIVIGANNATVSQIGVVQLNDTENSNSNTLAATANSVNTTWNYAQSAFVQANTATNIAQGAFNESNSFQSVINTSFATANVSFSAFANANAALAMGNSFQSIINSAFSRANTLDGIGSLTILTANGLTVNTGTTVTLTANGTVSISANIGNTTQVGMVQLNDTLTSTSTTLAATANMANTLFTDITAVNNFAAGAYNKANSGGTGGALTVTYLATNGVAANGGSSLVISGNGTVSLTGNSASTSQVGVVQLNDTENSNSVTQAATANAVNTTWAYAQSAFIHANSHDSIIGTIGGVANSGQNLALSAFSEANSFQSIINSAFSRANTVSGLGSITFIANTSQPGLTVNNGITLTLTANGTVIFGANAATTTQVGVVQLNDTTMSTSTTLGATANSVNVAWGYAQSAFIHANSHDSIIGTIGGVANSGQNLALSAFNEANSFQSVINSAFATANVAFSAFGVANSGQNLALSAFAEANSFQSIINTISTLANTAVQRPGDVMSGTLTVPNLDANSNVLASNVISNNYIQSSFIQGNIQSVPYTLQASDSGKVILISNTVTTNVTVPQQLQTFFRCVITSINTGTIYIVGSGASVLQNTSGTLGPKQVAGQWNSATVFCYSQNNYIIDGAII